MKHEREPLPWLDPRAEAPERIRDAISAGRSELPNAAVLARLSARLPVGGPGEPGGAGESGGSEPSSGLDGSGQSGGPPVGSGARFRSPSASASGGVPATAPSLLPGVLVGAALGALVSGALALWTSPPVAEPAAVRAGVSLTAEVERPAGAERAGEARRTVGADRASDRSAALPAASHDGGDPDPHAVSGADDSPGRRQVGAPSASASAVAPSSGGQGDTPSSGVSAGAPTPVAESESALLRRAQAALATSPATALALAGEHLARFPGGTFAQEREVIAISALAAMGRTKEAEARASSFSTAHPGSAHRPRVEALVPGAAK